MQKLKAILDLGKRLDDRFAKITSFLIVGMVGLIAIEVALRYGFNSPTLWAGESVQFAYGTYMILGGGYVLCHKGHIGVDIFYRRFSPRNRAILDLVTSLVFFAYVGVLLWYGVGFAWESVRILEHSWSTWGPPIWPAKLMLPLGALLLLIHGIVKFIRDLKTVVTKRESLAVEVSQRSL